MLVSFALWWKWKRKKKKEKEERLVDHELLSEAADGATWFTCDEDF